MWNWQELVVELWAPVEYQLINSVEVRWKIAQDESGHHRQHVLHFHEPPKFSLNHYRLQGVL